MSDDWEETGYHPLRAILATAIRRSLSDVEVPDEDLRAAAASIYATWANTAHEERPNSLKASRAVSERELTKMHDLCRSLYQHLEQMHHPAMSALWAEGFDYHQFKTTLLHAQEAARVAYSEMPESKNVGGQPKKIQAAEVTYTASCHYERMSGRRPTYTTNPATGEVTGKWPAFLSAVFDALYIKASVTAQVQALRKKTLRSDHG